MNPQGLNSQGLNSSGLSAKELKAERLQIIGIGSPSGDDRLGWEVIARLNALLPDGIACDLSALDRPGSGLIEYLNRSDDCWLIDALWSEEAPGQIKQPTLEQLRQSTTGVSGSHGFGLADTLLLAQRLGALPRHLELHCVTIDSAELLGEDLSPEVDAGVDGLVERLYRQLMERAEHSARILGR